MKIVLFYHSLVSDWNHGNAHFLRGIATELMKSGHNVQVFEPHNGWSFQNWIKERDIKDVLTFKSKYPRLQTHFHNSVSDFYPAVKDADLVIVHEWNSPELVKKLGELKKVHQFKLLFHDTHHRSATSPEEISKYDLSEYDGVLAFGDTITDLYLQNKWAKDAWTWHEAADTNVFHPLETSKKEGDLVWIGNWGDNERTEELIEFLIKPVKDLNLKAKMYGVRYPGKALQMLDEAGIEYGGYLPSYRVPEVFAAYKFTVHVPRKTYARELPGIPTIRPFEALACGIPLISAPWQDTENLFREGRDFIMAENGREMTEAMKMVMENDMSPMIRSGLETIQNQHTCAHRVDELINIFNLIYKRNLKYII